MPNSEIVVGNSRELKGVVFAGGRGTRLHPLRVDTNKHLLIVGDKPLVYYPIQPLVGAGIKDIYLVIERNSHLNLCLY